MKPEHKITIILPNSNQIEDQREPYQWQLHVRDMVAWNLMSKGKATTKEEAFEKAVAAYDSIEL